MQRGRVYTLSTIGDLIDDEVAVSAYCNACQHHGWLDLRAVAVKLGRDTEAIGPDTPFRRALVCRCGSRNVGFRLHPRPM